MIHSMMKLMFRILSAFVDLDTMEQRMKHQTHLTVLLWLSSDADDVGSVVDLVVATDQWTKTRLMIEIAMIPMLEIGTMLGLITY